MAFNELTSSYSRKNGEITHKTIQIKDGFEMEISFRLAYPDGSDALEDLLKDEGKEHMKNRAFECNDPACIAKRRLQQRPNAQSLLFIPKKTERPRQTQLAHVYGHDAEADRLRQ